MKSYPAIATLEFSNIASGMHATDAAIKRAPISLLKCGTISHGRYFTLIAGSTASVEESYEEGLFWGRDTLIDHVYLPDVATPLNDAIFGARVSAGEGALGVIETDTASCNIRATERALKGTPVTLIELRLADSLLHGKAVSIVNGELHDVEAAMELAVAYLDGTGHGATWKVITRPHDAFTAQINLNTNFSEAESINLNGELP